MRLPVQNAPDHSRVNRNGGSFLCHRAHTAYESNLTNAMGAMPRVEGAKDAGQVTIRDASSGRPVSIDAEGYPRVSVIVPVRDEERYIGRCISGLLRQHYPWEHLEILVVDGLSEDRTREIVQSI